MPFLYLIVFFAFSYAQSDPVYVDDGNASNSTIYYIKIDLETGTRRVIGGSPAPEGNAPYQVSLLFQRRHDCGGAILNKRWVITAAHCIRKLGSYTFPRTLRVGTNNANSGGIILKVNNWIMHEKYKVYMDSENRSHVENDIALLRMHKDISFSKTVQPIELTDEDTQGGLDALATGWGIWNYKTNEYPKKLQMATLTTIDRKTCEQKLLEVKIVTMDSDLCTYTKPGQGTCHGDSGGPLVYNNKLVGIASNGHPCAKGYPDVFTRVYSYINWIKHKIRR